MATTSLALVSGQQQQQQQHSKRLQGLKQKHNNSSSSNKHKLIIHRSSSSCVVSQIEAQLLKLAAIRNRHHQTLFWPCLLTTLCCTVTAITYSAALLHRPLLFLSFSFLESNFTAFCSFVRNVSGYCLSGGSGFRILPTFKCANRISRTYLPPYLF